MENKGFTLLEVLVAMGIFLLIIGGIASLMIFGWRSNKIVWEQLSMQNEGRKVAQDLVNELRTAAASSIGAYALESAGAQQMVFYSNIDDDSWRERIRYFKDGTLLKRGVTKPTGNPLVYNPAGEIITIVAHDVANGANPLFYYYGENYTGTEDPLSDPVAVTAVRIIKLSLDLEEDPQSSPAPLHIETMAEVRNLKTN
ncbi:MAG TPA: prepilin-type N-terminal cleavage/methylation domain-containing protein [Patescibacteria group bacterium]|nr:prepilin-type N-terminal cleavage/methylation domain-containing protein [Patescibacteria group bacterium]